MIYITTLLPAFMSNLALVQVVGPVEGQVVVKVDGEFAGEVAGEGHSPALPELKAFKKFAGNGLVDGKLCRCC